MSQNEDYLNLAGVIYRRLGNLDKAFDYLKRGLGLILVHHFYLIM